MCIPQPFLLQVKLSTREYTHGFAKVKQQISIPDADLCNHGKPLSQPPYCAAQRDHSDGYFQARC